MITDIIKIENNIIDIQMSYSFIEKENCYIGNIHSLNIPFTSPTEEKTSEISQLLINVLFKSWLERDLVTDKLINKFNFCVQDDAYEFTYDPNSVVGTFAEQLLDSVIYKLLLINNIIYHNLVPFSKHLASLIKNNFF